jgi:predicted enzyme related to lactoylglutathione lyase
MTAPFTPSPKENVMSGDAISWFEIPVRDLHRAQRFYETVLGRALQRETMGAEQMAVFPAEEGRAKGCIHLPSQPIAPSAAGTRVYLDATPSLDAALDRVQGAGGRITTPKVALPPGMGFFAHVTDTEGNVVGLHALA